MTKILLVGCGKMGGAMLEGWLSHGIAAKDVCVIEPVRSQGHVTEISSVLLVFGEVSHVPEGFIPDVVIFAVKPQIMPEILPAYKKYSTATFLSIAAGKTIASFEAILGSDKAIIRAMPNLPATIGKGAMVACVNRHVSDAQQFLAEKLLAASGKVLWVEDESLMDAVTAISGSGPAYIFHFIECLEKAGKKLGLPDDLARSLAYLTVEGSVLLATKSDKTAEELRIQVTSPKGTTQAALDVLMPGLQPLLDKATEAACKRSEELAG